MTCIQPEQEEGIIRRIIQKVHQSLDLDGTIQELAYALGEYLKADRCFVSRFDVNKQTLSPPTREYRSSDEIESMIKADVNLWKSLCSFTIDLCQQPEAIDFNDQLYGISSEAQELLGHIKVQSGIGCAVKYNGECQAILFVHNVQSKHAWTSTEKEIIEIVAHEAGVAIHQAQLFKEKSNSEERYRLINQVTNDAIWDWDLSTNRVLWNDGIYLLFKYTPDQVGSDIHWWIEHIHPQDRERVFNSISETIQSGDQFWSEEYRFLCGNGTVSSVIDRGYVAHDVSGQGIRMIGSMIDVTERTLKELQLANRIRQQKTVTALGVSALSGKPILELMNEVVTGVTQSLAVPYSKVLEYDSAQRMVRFKAVSGFKQDLVGQERTLDFEPQAQYTLQTDQPVITNDIYTETRFKPSTLHYDYNLVSGISVIIGSPEHPWGILQADTSSKQQFTEDDIDFMQSIANLLAITIKRQQMERMLQERESQLAESNRDLEQFAMIASHDLQAPLRKIQIFCEQIYQDAKDKLKPESLDLMQRVDRSITTAQTLVHDLLTLSKVNKSSQPFSQIDLATVIDKVITNLEAQIRLKNATVDVHVDSIFFGDPIQWEHLMQNLIENGLKYQPDGQAPIIKIQSQCLENQFYEVTVQDNGIGLDPAQAERIFQPFERLHGKSSPYTGTGVGLSICQRIVERHHGNIRVESTPGQGATFIVTVPYGTGD
jgi:PAS domain S-box-containing protein